MIDIGSLLSTIIYLISSSLLYPTLFLLVAGFLFTVIYAGAFSAEWLERARLKRCPAGELPDLIVNSSSAGSSSGKENSEEKHASILPHRVRNHIAQLRLILKGDKHSDAQIENLVQESTLNWWKSMDRLRIMVRLGPSLGLMGTLIPMGTGLASLGTGDMARLSSDLVIAFTTTVVGLAIGMTAYCIYTIKRRWIEEDIKNMELATELLTSELPDIELAAVAKESGRP